MLCCFGLGARRATVGGTQSAKAHVAGSLAHRVSLADALQQWCNKILDAPTTTLTTVQPDTRCLLGRFDIALQSLCISTGAQGGSIVLFCGVAHSRYDLLEVAAWGSVSSWPWSAPAAGAAELLMHTAGLQQLLSKNPVLIATTDDTPLVPLAAAAAAAGVSTAAAKQQGGLFPALNGQAVHGGDVLLVALTQQGSTCGALALQWGANAACTLRRPELAALSRTAQLLAYSVLAHHDVPHVDHLSKVCELLRMVSCATTLRELFSKVLSTTSRLLQARLGIEVQLVMALTHGSQQPAAFIVPKAVDDSATLAMIMASAQSIDLNHAAHMPHGACHGAHMPASGAGPVSDGHAATGGPGVRAVLASPAMTVLQQLLLEQVPQLQGRGGAVHPCYSLIPHCSSHVLDDTRPSRDVVLCQKLLQVQLQSMAVCLCPSEQHPAASATTSSLTALAEHAAMPLLAVASTGPRTGPCLFPRRAGVVPGGPPAGGRNVPAGGSSSSRADPAPGVPHWAFYLCSGDLLPGAVLKMLADELGQIMELVLPTLNATLVGPLAAEWALLGGQLLAAAGQSPSASRVPPRRALTFDHHAPGGRQAAAGAIGAAAARAGSAGMELSLERVVLAGAVGQGGAGRPKSSASHCRALLRRASTASDDAGMAPARSQSWISLAAAGAAAAAAGVQDPRLLPAGRPVKPSLLLEELAPSSPLDLLINSIHSTMSASAFEHSNAYKEDERAAARQDLAGLELFEVIGRGGQGLVFRGSIHGLEAAVKVVMHQGGGEAACDASMQQQQQQAGAPPAANPQDAIATYDDARMLEAKRAMLRGALELAITSSISHPTIVQLYAYFTDVAVTRTSGGGDRSSASRRQSARPQLQLAAEAEAAAAAARKGAFANVRLMHRDDVMVDGSSAATPLHTLLCLEYCDAGTLLGAAKAGTFRQAGASATAGAASPSLVPLYTSLLEVALALRHLHGKRLVHGDVKAANVLLKSNSRDPRGWACKLSDFGCVRILNEPGPDGRMGFRQAQPIGTLPFMAPEMFVKGALLDGSIDMYAFGIMMWELLMCRVPFAGIDPKILPARVVNQRLRPTFHPLTPPGYSSLASLCWSNSPRHRPGAIALVAHLQSLLGIAQREEAMLRPRLQTAGTAQVIGGTSRQQVPSAAELQRRSQPSASIAPISPFSPSVAPCSSSGAAPQPELQRASDASAAGEGHGDKELAPHAAAAAAAPAAPRFDFARVPSMSRLSGLSMNSGADDDDAAADPAAGMPASSAAGHDGIGTTIRPGAALRMYLQRQQLLRAGAAAESHAGGAPMLPPGPSRLQSLRTPPGA